MIVCQSSRMLNSFLCCGSTISSSAQSRYTFFLFTTRSWCRLKILKLSRRNKITGNFLCLRRCGLPVMVVGSFHPVIDHLRGKTVPTCNLGSIAHLVHFLKHLLFELQGVLFSLHTPITFTNNIRLIDKG